MTHCPHVSEFGYRTECKRCRERRVKREIREQEQAHIAFYRRSGHCGACGQPGNYCMCTDNRPCGCRGLHVLGSGLTQDAATVFADPVPDQDGLFDVEQS